MTGWDWWQAPGPAPVPAPPARPLATPSAGPGPRFCGRIGPSLFMTAVERREQQEKGRRELESIGRQCLRMLGLTAEERGRNDLPPRESLRDAMRAPSGRFADLLAAGLREGAEKGDRETRRHCRGRLGAAGPTALVTGGSSAHQTGRQGWRGLTADGRRSVRDAGAVMDQDYGSLAFWTVTLTDDVAETATREQIATFQSRLLFFTRRAMIRAGVPPFCVLVAELHPGRRAWDGALVPHWHLVVRVSSQPFARWAVRKEHLNRAALAAHRAAFHRERGHTQRLTVLPQKTGAARYLAKYMSKARSTVEALRGTQQGRMVPRQWWSWTGEVRELVMRCRIKPPSGFLGWCCRWWQELAELGQLAATDVVAIGSDGPVVGRWFVWSDEAALDRAIEQWTGEELARLDLLRTG